VKATQFEFRFRLAIGTVIYIIGFWGPWLRFGPSAEANPTRLWSWLAVELARRGILPIQIAYLAITILAVVLAILGAGFRLWGTAYLGRTVVSGNAMQAGEVVAAGPYRHVRNPLYLGSMLTALAVSILMPASGALFFVVALSIFVVRLALGEEAFLKAKIGDAYVEYCRKVSRWLPSISPRLPGSGVRPAWLTAALGEIFPLGVALCFLVFAWNYDSQLLIRCVLICFGISLIARAIPRKQALNA
jgi:protein-S-isoprenylcysteine O-methyltransferase Ste14